MTPEIEAHIKQQTWDAMRQRNGDEWVGQHPRFFEHQWEWVKELRMIDSEVDLKSEVCRVSFPRPGLTVFS